MLQIGLGYIIVEQIWIGIDVSQIGYIETEDEVFGEDRVFGEDEVFGEDGEIEVSTIFFLSTIVEEEQLEEAVECGVSRDN